VLVDTRLDFTAFPVFELLAVDVIFLATTVSGIRGGRGTMLNIKELRASCHRGC
jgi:hypothetical protein